MMHVCRSHWQVTQREHREIFQLPNAPQNAPQNAPAATPQAAPNVPPHNPNAAKNIAKDKIVKAEATGNKIRSMKQSMDAALAQIANIGKPPAAPVVGAPDALTAAATSVDAIKTASNINTLPADALTDMMQSARALGPEAGEVCDKIQDAMTQLQAALTNEPDAVKQKQITDMAILLENNAKLILADLLTPDVKTGAPKGIGSLFGTMQPEEAAKITDAANASPTMTSINDSSLSEDERSKLIGKVMCDHGVTIEKDASGQYIAVAPLSPFAKFLNQINGIFRLLGFVKTPVKGAETNPSTPSNGPQTTLNQAEQDAIKKNIKDPAFGMATEKGKAKTAKATAEKALYGMALAPNTPPPVPAPGSLKGQLTALTAEKTKLETDIAALKAANPPDQNAITTETGKLNVKMSEITAKEAEIKVQEEIVKKEDVKMKYIDDLQKAATDSVTAMTEVQTYITTLNTKRTYKNADSKIVGDALSGIQIDGPGNDLSIRCLNVNLSAWQAMQDLAAQKFGIVKTDMDLTQPDIMKDPEKCLAALKVIKQRLADHEKKIDSRIGALTAVGASNDEAADVAKIEMNVPGIQFEYKNAQWSFATDPGANAYDAYLKSGEDNVTAVLKNYMDQKIQSDPLSPLSVSFLDKALEYENSINPNTVAIRQYKQLIKDIPLLKQNVSVSTPMVKVTDVPGLKDAIEKHPLFTGNTLDADLKTNMGM